MAAVGGRSASVANGNSEYIYGGPMTALTSDQWNRLRELAESETGMDLSGPRFGRLQDAVAKVMGHPPAEDELTSVLSRPDARARFLEQVTGQLTVGESFFLRNEHHFRVLRESVLPQILRENDHRREVRVWSAGCATGEEAHSLAIVLDQLLVDQTGWNVSVLGTDLNPEFLKKAQTGRYRAWSFRQTTIHHDGRYFTPQADEFCLADHIRRCVRFAYLNLVKDPYPSAMNGTVGLDLILFRNVAIYLKSEVVTGILARFLQALRPGGWLLLGETEVGMTRSEGWEIHRLPQATFYRKQAGDVRPEELHPPMPLPVLAEVSGSWGANDVAVPELPVWVPLPTFGGANQASPAGCGATSLAAATTPHALDVWQRIEQSLQQGAVPDAERAVERVIDLRERAVLRLRLARWLLDRADTATARTQLRGALRDDPLLLEAHLLEASLSEESGDLVAAEQAYRKALYLNRNCAIAHLHLALILRQQGDEVGARRSLRTTLQVSAEKDAHAIVEYGEGLCYGRLREMILMLTGDVV